MKASRFRSAILLSALSLVMTLGTGALGSPFLRVLRWITRWWFYWGSLPIIVGGFILADQNWIALLVASLWISQGLVVDIFHWGKSWFTSHIVGVFVGAAVFAAGAAKILFNEGVRTQVQLVEWISKLPLALPIKTEILVGQLPSMILIFFVLSSALGAILERRVLFWIFGVDVRFRREPDLLQFRLPDYFLWIGLGSLAGSLWYDAPAGEAVPLIEVICANSVNVLATLYFFQGLSILEYFLKKIHAGIFTRVFGYMFLFGQVVIFSFVGFIDFWVDFRTRWGKTKEPLKL